jgi:hypothetical protein
MVCVATIVVLGTITVSVFHSVVSSVCVRLGNRGFGPDVAVTRQIRAQGFAGS